MKDWLIRCFRIGLKCFLDQKRKVWFLYKDVSMVRNDAKCFKQVSHSTNEWFWLSIVSPCLSSVYVGARVPSIWKHWYRDFDTFSYSKLTFNTRVLLYQSTQKVKIVLFDEFSIRKINRNFIQKITATNSFLI